MTVEQQVLITVYVVLVLAMIVLVVRLARRK
jgi:hypothetical protein